LHDFVRSETNNMPTLTFHQRRSPHIRFDLISVMMAIDLDDQLSRHAGEVGEIWPDGMLTAELDALHSVCTDQLPADAFGATGVSA